MFSILHSHSTPFTRGIPQDLLRLALLLLLPAMLVTACPEGDDDDSSSAGDDDDVTAGDDDDAAADDDDDLWADDDDAVGDDDAAAGDACTVQFGPPEDPFDLTGTCEENAEACEGGSDPMNPSGSCSGGLTCCVDTDQCETVAMGSCAATQDECEGEPPEGAPGFPELGCPQATPICCLPAGPPV